MNLHGVGDSSRGRKIEDPAGGRRKKGHGAELINWRPRDVPGDNSRRGLYSGR